MAAETTGQHNEPRPLTERQRKIVEMIQTSLAQRSYPPSMREIGDACGLASLSSVTHQLARLQQLGYVQRVPGKPRAMEVIRDADGRLLAPEPAAEPVTPPQDSTVVDLDAYRAETDARMAE